MKAIKNINMFLVNSMKNLALNTINYFYGCENEQNDIDGHKIKVEIEDENNINEEEQKKYSISAKDDELESHSINTNDDEHNITEEKELDYSIDEEEPEIFEEASEFFFKIKEVNTFIKILEKLKLTEYINIPRICSIGNQSNGKTSILTNIIGLDILPKGDGVVTRRPLELRLNKIKTGKPYIYFNDDKNNKITDFSSIKDKINILTNSICGNNKDIKDSPLIINVFSQTCPNLTIIDLPGISRVPVGDQPKNIEEITKEMTLKYINDPYTIILCAIDVNQDITTSDGLYLAKEIDYYGERTLGVLTKIDLMDEGTDCKEILLNKFIPLKLGYIAVKNRSKLDLINNVNIQEGLRKEKLFFENNVIYKNIDKKLLGTHSLVERLVELYTNMFYKNIGDFTASINQHLKRLNNELLLIGKPLSQNLFEKNIIMNKLIKNYCNIFLDLLMNKNNEVKCDLKTEINNNDLITKEERNKIKNLYDNFLLKYCSNANNFIELPTKIPKNISSLQLLSPNLKKIENESILLFQIIVEHLFKLSHRAIHKVFKRYNSMENKIVEVIDNIFRDEVKKTKNMIEQILKYELTYEFTNDKEFLEKYSDQEIISYKNDKIILQNILNDYFLIIIRNIRNIIPKTIQYKLIIHLESNLYNNLVNYLINNQEILGELKESDNYIKIRKNLTKTKNILEKLIRKVNNSLLASRALLKYEKNERKKHLLILQKEKRDKLFKNSLKKLKEIRNDISKGSNNEENIKGSLESMCIIGSIINENIIEEKEKNPEKFIPINEAIKVEEENPIFCLGLLAKNLENQGIMTVIEKEEVKTEEEKELSISTLDFIANGMINKTKFDLHFDFGEERNEQLLFNEYEQKRFKDLIKEKISQKFGISKEKLILADPQRGSFQISLFQMDNFNKLSLEQLKSSFKMDKDLCGIKEIQENLIFKACKLTKNMLDAKGNRSSGWGIGEKRGGFPYRPPIGWIGFGLNVTGKYDNGNDDWLAYNGNKNEWAVAYHGVGVGGKAKNVAEAIHMIVKGDCDKTNEVVKEDAKVFLIPGNGQVHHAHKNINKLNSDEYVGKGVYCSPNPKVMDSYAREYQGYRMSLMLRVKPQRIRYCDCVCENEKSSYWVLNGKSDEMRPYRILVKKV